MTDWREIFKKYANRIGEEEGVYFLRRYDWTDEEWGLVNAAIEEMENEDNK